MSAASTTARQDELLDDLVALFLAEGFRGFTLADLAARLRCSKTTLYALGETKEQLTTNAVRRYFRDATATVDHQTDRHEAPADRIVAYLQAIGDALRPASQAFMDDLAASAPAREVYERNTASAAERLGRFIDEGAARGEFRAVHALFVADTIATTMRRIQTGEVLATTGLHDADAYQQLAELVLDGLRTARPGTSP